MFFPTVLRDTLKNYYCENPKRDNLGHCRPVGMLKEIIISQGTFEVLKIDTHISNKKTLKTKKSNL